MSRIAKWNVTVVVGLGLAGIVFLVVLRVASGLEAKWALAGAGAASVLGLVTAIGSSWVSHEGDSPMASGRSQGVSRSRLQSKSGHVIGNARNVHINSDPSQGRASRGGRRRS